MYNITQITIFTILHVVLYLYDSISYHLLPRLCPHCMLLIKIILSIMLLEIDALGNNNMEVIFLACHWIGSLSVLFSIFPSYLASDNVSNLQAQTTTDPGVNKCNLVWKQVAAINAPGTIVVL